MIVPDCLRLPLHFDPVRLRADLDLLSSEGWIAHYVPANYDGEWSVVPLRSGAEAKHPIQMIFPHPLTRDYVDTPYLAGLPYFREVLGAFACPLDSARLMRLGPGSRIKEHRDHDLSFEQGVVRLHIPVATHADVDFRLNGRRLAMEAGTTWYLRLSDPHSVWNPGPETRVHLVVDAQVTPWIETLFAAALRDAA